MKQETVIKNHKDEEWLWPAEDGVGGVHCCWDYMISHENVPELISKHVKNRLVVVQAGGNAGFYVKQYAKLFQTVYTFEPEPVNFYCLTNNVTEYNVLKFQGCLGEHHKTVGLDRTLSDTGSTHVSGKGVLPTFLIDDLNLPRLNLIHLDIEGYELFALRGAVNTIKQFYPVIALECHDKWAARYNTSVGDIFNFLEWMGYQEVGKAMGDKIFKHRDSV